MHPTDLTVSIVIPTHGFAQSVSELLNSIKSQTHQPTEIIIVDSSPDDTVKEVVNTCLGLNIIHIQVVKKFPGEARNIGMLRASGDYIALLDSKTIPQDNWIKDALNHIAGNDMFFFGTTCYIAQSPFQKVLQCCLYGKLPIETSPGTVFKKSALKRVGYFIENTRTADDLEWRGRIKRSGIPWHTPKQGYLVYKQISKSLYAELKRQFIYQCYGAFIDIQWKKKITICTASLLLLLMIGLSLGGILSPVVPLICTLGASGLSFLYRSTYAPLTRGFTISELLPFYWLTSGLCGLCIDLVKLPGFILGGLLCLGKCYRQPPDTLKN